MSPSSNETSSDSKRTNSIDQSRKNPKPQLQDFNSPSKALDFRSDKKKLVLKFRRKSSDGVATGTGYSARKLKGVELAPGQCDGDGAACETEEDAVRHGLPVKGTLLHPVVSCKMTVEGDGGAARNSRNGAVRREKFGDGGNVFKEPGAARVKGDAVRSARGGQVVRKGGEDSHGAVSRLERRGEEANGALRSGGSSGDGIEKEGDGTVPNKKTGGGAGRERERRLGLGGEK